MLNYSGFKQVHSNLHQVNMSLGPFHYESIGQAPW